MNSSICAIIPTYNRAAMLRECIDSILRQTRLPDKIIVVNDGSTDETEEVVKSYGSRLTLLTKKNGGKSSALNLALDSCETDYIWICDDDDIAAPEGLEQLARVLDSDANIDFVLGSYRMFYGDFSKKVYANPPVKVRTKETDIKVLFLEDMFTCQFAMLVRRSLYQKVGPFHEDMIRSQDYEMCIRLSRNGKAALISDVIFFQRQHAGIRGSAKEPFLSDNNQQKWLTYDQKIFNALHDIIPLTDYTPSFAKSWNFDQAMRAGLIERASVFAKRGLWDYAIKDLESAIIISDEKVTADEINILETVMGFEPAWQVLRGNTAKIQRLRNIYHLNKNGYQTMVAACRPLVWYAKNSFWNGNFRNSFEMVRLLYQILGGPGMLFRSFQSFIG